MIDLGGLFFGGFMRPLYRDGVSKFHQASGFRHDVSQTKALNMVRPMRGGWRL